MEDAQIFQWKVQGYERFKGLCILALGSKETVAGVPVSNPRRGTVWEMTSYATATKFDEWRFNHVHAGDSEAAQVLILAETEPKARAGSWVNYPCHVTGNMPNKERV